MKFIVVGRYDRIEARQGFEVVYDRSIWDEDLANSICERVNNTQAELSAAQERIAELEAAIERVIDDQVALFMQAGDEVNGFTDWYLKREGYDPEQVVENGRAFIEEMKAKYHASETETP